MTKSPERPIHIHNNDFGPDARYTRIRKEVLDDLDLQTRAPLAFVILVHLLGKPPWWTVNTEYFMSRGFGGQNQVRAAFRELQHRGYMSREQHVQGGRFIGTTYEVYGTSRTEQAGAPIQCAEARPANPTDAVVMDKTAGQSQRTEAVREVLTTETPKGSQSRSIKELQSEEQPLTSESTRLPGSVRKQPRIIPRRSDWIHPDALEIRDLNKRQAYMQTQANVKWIYTADAMPISKRDALLMGEDQAVTTSSSRQ